MTIFGTSNGGSVERLASYQKDGLGLRKTLRRQVDMHTLMNGLKDWSRGTSEGAFCSNLQLVSGSEARRAESDGSNGDD